jgi:hypothetical protein
MKRVLLAFAISAIATLSTYAQVTFVLTSAASGVSYTATQRPGGLNSDYAIYKTPLSANFGPTATGSVSTPNCNPADANDEADCAANGIAIVARDASGNFLGWGEPTYVSATQINFHYRKSALNDATQATRFVYKQRNPVDGVYYSVGDSNITPTTVEKRNLQPYLTYTTIAGVTGGYLTGTLYGCTTVYDGFTPCGGYVALKSLTDGAANAREYNGWPSLLQIYVTGYNGVKLSQPGQEFPAFQCDGTFGGFNTFQVYGPSYGNGVFTANVFWGDGQFSGPVWGGVGHRTITLGYGTIVSGNQLGWIQGPADALGNRPRGLVYF